MQDQELDAIDFHHVPAAFQAPVRAWYEGRLAALAVDGTRSVHLPHPAGGGRVLKLKGAGLSGGAVELGVFHRTGPKAPVFDFEGRMMEDVAAGHDGAFRGGASFQQAATEFQVSRRLEAIGYRVVPCLGYGRIERGGLSSWFALFDHEPGLSGETIYPQIPLEEWIHLNGAIGPLLVELAVEHDLIGYCWYAKAPGGRWLLRDLHPFRFADPFDMSQLSWVMQLFFALHVRGNAQRLRLAEWREPRMPEDLHVWQYRAFCPEASLADHDALRQELVIPYMLGAPADFSVERLVTVLRGNRITAALLALCPARFARF